MGYSFAAGTTDGAGAFKFQQGTRSSNPLWNTLRNFIMEPSASQVACHGAKPILLTTGEVGRRAAVVVAILGRADTC